MRRNCRSLGGRLADDRGMAVVWMLIWLPVLIFALAGVLHFPMFVGATGVDLQGAVQRAAKAAAMQITAKSYASANPEIDPVEADKAAREYLAQNLRLDPLTLEPRRGSWLARAPQVSLAIANGPFPQTITPPGADGPAVEFPMAGVILRVDAAIWTPGRAETETTVWAAARVHRE